MTGLWVRARRGAGADRPAGAESGCGRRGPAGCAGLGAAPDRALAASSQARHRDAAVPTLLATPVVAAMLKGMDTATVAVAAGIAVLIGVAALWRGFTWTRLVSLPGAVGTGIPSATLNVIGGVGGPPVGLYAANAGWDPPESRASLQAFFLVQGIVTVLSSGSPGRPVDGRRARDLQGAGHVARAAHTRARGSPGSSGGGGVRRCCADPRQPVSPTRPLGDTN